jgi:hypothetical protein
VLRSIVEAAVDGIIVIDDAASSKPSTRAPSGRFGHAAVEVRTERHHADARALSLNTRYMRHYLETGEQRIIGIVAKSPPCARWQHVPSAFVRRR